MSNHTSIKKGHLFVSCILVMLLLFGTYSLYANAADHRVSKIKDKWGNLSYYMTESSTIFDIDLYRGSVVLGGRENWNAGDQIVFHIKAGSGATYEVGILPAEDLDSAPEYNSYGGFISEKLYIDGNEREITITVPETGEYGFGIQHYLNPGESVLGIPSTVHLNVEINRVFENQV